jgi:phosphatidylserine/phosphatidylglycerophosphate/cardiolipin synthase-like enzyme
MKLPFNKRLLWLPCGALFLWLGWSWSHRQPGRTAATATLPPLPQDQLVRVYFNHNLSASYLEPYRPVQRAGDDLEAIIIGEIDRATRSIDIAVQELKLPRIAKALANRQQAGVAVRVILENTYHRSVLTPAEIAQLSVREKSRYQEWVRLVDSNHDGQLSAAELANRDALTILANASIPVIDDTADGSQGNGLMHHKFMAIDGQRTLVTSANWTMSDVHGDLNHPTSRGNANNLLVIDSPAVANTFGQEFNLMWGDGPGGAADSRFHTGKPARDAIVLPLGSGQIAIQFSPATKQTPWANTTNGVIARTLDRAQTSTSLALFVFSDPQLGNSLEAANQRGVKISALIDRDFAYRPYSQMLAMLGMATCKSHNNSHFWAKPITSAGVPDLTEGDLLHHKFAVIDHNLVVTGSHNWSAAANYKNDETLLVIENPQVTAHFQREFDRLYGSAKLGVPDRHRRCQGGDRENQED